MNAPSPAVAPPRTDQQHQSPPDSAGGGADTSSDVRGGECNGLKT